MSATALVTAGDPGLGSAGSLGGSDPLALQDWTIHASQTATEQVALELGSSQPAVAAFSGDPAALLNPAIDLNAWTAEHFIRDHHSLGDWQVAGRRGVGRTGRSHRSYGLL